MNYQEIHDKIIFRAKTEDRKKLKKIDPFYIYYEAHHILPKCIYPEYKDFKLFPWNKVLLTAREHYIIHLLLVKMHPNNHKIARAAFMNTVCSDVQRRFTNRLYAWLKEKMHNEPRTKEHCEKLSLACKGLKKSEEGRKNIKNAQVKKRKDKTYEELYGEEKAKQLKLDQINRQIGKPNGTKGKPKPGVSAYRSKPVHCIELNMDFKSGLAGAQYVGLKNSSDINKVAQGKVKRAGGYTWRYI